MGVRGTPNWSLGKTRHHLMVDPRLHHFNVILDIRCHVRSRVENGIETGELGACSIVGLRVNGKQESLRKPGDVGGDTRDFRLACRSSGARHGLGNEKGHDCEGVGQYKYLFTKKLDKAPQL